MPAGTENITLQEDKPSLRVTSGLYVGGDLRQQDEFADVGALAPWKTRFFMKFRHLIRATGAPMQTLVCFKLFPYPMD